MGVARHETRRGTGGRRSQPTETTSPPTCTTPYVTAVRELVIRHLRVRSFRPAIRIQTFPDFFWLFKRVRVPRLAQAVVKRHREERVRREEVRGVAPELRLHNSEWSDRWDPLGWQDIRLLWRIRVIRRVRIIRNDRNVGASGSR